MDTSWIMSYFLRDFFGAPDARHDDGVMWLLLIRGNVTRMALIKLLVSMDTGEHVNIPGVDIFPVTAVKISVHYKCFISVPVLQ